MTVPIDSQCISHASDGHDGKAWPVSSSESRKGQKIAYTPVRISSSERSVS